MFLHLTSVSPLASCAFKSASLWSRARMSASMVDSLAPRHSSIRSWVIPAQENKCYEKNYTHFWQFTCTDELSVVHGTGIADRVLRSGTAVLLFCSVCIAMFLFFFLKSKECTVVINWSFIPVTCAALVAFTQGRQLKNILTNIGTKQ